MIDLKFSSDMLCVCIAREIKDGDLVGQGISTPLVASAYMLAKLTHAPHCIVSYTVGNLLSLDTFPISLLYYEKHVIDHLTRPWSFAEVVGNLVPLGCINVEFFRPAQLDPYGNSNNVVIGEYFRPKVRLPGCGGISDATTIWERIYYYVPDHNKNVFVEKVDFRSGLGFIGRNDEYLREELGLIGKGPTKVITNLCTMDFDEDSKRMRLVSIHPGVTLEEIQENTGFELIVSDEVCETAPPTEEELRLLDERIDPYGIRFLECLRGKQRLNKISEIIEKEMNHYKEA